MKYNKTECPIIGHKYEVDFGNVVYHLHFIDDKQMHYKAVGNAQEEGTVKVQRTMLRHNLYLVSWQESDKTTVTHVQDFQNMVIYSNITTSENDFIYTRGNLKALINN
ncbi:hypothetical protein CLV24_10913 [Pontibacter ummariensis]|uniref:MoaF-like domain-containing protein n=1 Tax=Pontibacter ummariensis TaxID=1610492 RepID=A0A239FX48_9BACT|nr:MoaF N-terminal domain-containing protein [Pontibacter ummariensis]PRY11888.1 hypothetical protein CLV24_10913 [Pontibacter ummariensis]SNS61315.1 hypothetical protein SAMN06296052_109157 [Pontibacter ummariensis]